MPPIQYRSIIALEDNTADVYVGCTEVLLRIARNILQNPQNPQYRSISLGSKVVTSKLLPASGAMQCLFEMGFQEGSDKLVLPLGSSLDHVKYIHDELLRRRELRNRKSANLTRQKSEPNPVLSLLVNELTAYINSLHNNFFDAFIDAIVQVWKCENAALQLKALKCIPLCNLKKNVERNIRAIQEAVKKKELEEEIIDCQELLLLELCKWFKNSFFSWVNAPKCSMCGSEDTKFMERRPSTREASAIEVYVCSVCGETVLFPRHNDPEKLLETRRGRCGEWTHCFFLMCRSLGWDVRYVLDQTDHVWVEVYSYIKKRWVHCDPCENLVDSPLIYETGWKKDLSYIIAFSKDDIQDVTWRYSCNFSKILKNRKKCPEEQLVDVICNIRKILSHFVPGRKKEFIVKRAALELVDLLTQKSATEVEKQGRSSGSLAWRLARGEIKMPQEFQSFVWRIDKNFGETMEFSLSYCTTTDEYLLGGTEKIIRGWKNGLYKSEDVFRKEENDWKTIYLAREEGTNIGKLTWRFETDDDLSIGGVELKLVRQKYENGKVFCKLCTDQTCVNIPEGVTSFSTDDFKGSNFLELTVELCGGIGKNAWQHAQVLRQSMDDHSKTFEIIIRLIRT